MGTWSRTRIPLICGLTSCLLLALSTPAYASCALFEHPDHLLVNLTIAFITGIIGIVLSFRAKKPSAGMIYFLAAGGFISVAVMSYLLPIETAFRHFYPKDLASQSGDLRVKVDYSIFFNAIRFDIFAMISAVALVYSFKSKKTQKLGLLLFSLILVLSLTLGHVYILAYTAIHDRPCCTSSCHHLCPESLYDINSNKLCK